LVDSRLVGAERAAARQYQDDPPKLATPKFEEIRVRCRGQPL